MYWTNEHDVLLCREVVSENPYKTRKGSSQRNEMWDKIANTLNSCTKPVFAVDKGPVRDHVGILINRIKKRAQASRRPSPQNLKSWWKKLWRSKKQLMQK